MEIHATIEALLHYANAHLLLDELDYVYSRNRILSLLKLDSFELYEVNDDEIDAMTGPAEILGALCNYAVSQKIITESEKCDFSRRLMDCVLKRPGEIADIFGRLQPLKALEWLNDYAQKSGYVKPAAKRWEAKATKGKLEIAFSGSDCVGSVCGIAAVEEKKKKIKYPACKKCRDNEGFGSSLNLRTVPMELYGERMFFCFKNRATLVNQGMIVSEYHRPLQIDKTSLNKMFDFAAAYPKWMIAAAPSDHESYLVSYRQTPFNKAGEIARFKSKEYPYIAISTVE